MIEPRSNTYKCKISGGVAQAQEVHAFNALEAATHYLKDILKAQGGDPGYIISVEDESGHTFKVFVTLHIEYRAEYWYAV